MAAPEFSRTIAVDDIGECEISMTIDANADERQALAKRFQLQGIDSLTAEMGVRAEANGRLYVVRGHLEAEVVQSCVVSLQPVPARVEERFAAVFHRSEARDIEDLAELALGAGGDWDDPEPIEGSTIDVGELVAQHLSLALDPYPRAPGVSAQGILAAHGSDKTSPFAALKTRKRKEDT